MAKYKCKVCGYIHEGNKAPDVCPVCGVPASEFEEIKDEAVAGKKRDWIGTVTCTLLFMLP